MTEQDILIMRRLRRSYFRFFTVEPVFFLVYFASSFTDSVVTDLIETRVCLHYLNLPPLNCTLPLSSEVVQSVQQTTSHIITAKTIIEAFFPAVLSFFIGPWTDVRGRRPFLLASVAGYGVFYLFWVIFAYFRQISPVYFLVSSLALSVTGGIVSIFLCCYCYIGDVTSEAERGLRMACVQISLMVGILAGSLLIPKVYSASGEYGPLVAFAVSATISFIAFLYVFLMLPESLLEKDSSPVRFFNLSHVADMFKAVFKKRSNNGRMILLFVNIICTIDVSIMRGEGTVKYLTLQQRFAWTLVEYSNFSALASLITVVISLSGMWIFSRLLKLKDLCIALVVICLSLISQIVVALSPSSIWFIIAINVGCLEVLIVPVNRSITSKLVQQDELGKAFAFISSMEAAIPLLVAPIYTLVYSAVLGKMPLAVYFLSVGFSTINLILLLVILPWDSCCRVPVRNK